VVGYGPFSLWLIHKEGLCPSSGDINRLMMMLTWVGFGLIGYANLLLCPIGEDLSLALSSLCFNNVLSHNFIK
jgi:hypothetical protein